MNAATSHPLAAAYLHDLELLLHDLDPGARAEVLGGVREHLAAAVGPDATSEQVRAALTALGSPQSIAEEAYADQPSTRVAAPMPPTWHAVIACALNGVGLAYLALISFSTSGGADVLFAAPLFLLPWAVVVALSMLSPVWTQRQKVTSICLGPATLLCLALITAVFLAIFGPSPINAIPVLALFGTSAWILVRLARHAMR